jgi:hypothetical protein
MTMIATDELTDGQLIDLPPAAGDVNQPRFEPHDDWVRTADAASQKTAMWRWFATRYEELETSTPHDQDGNYFFGRKEPPVKADEVLQERFGAVVSPEVLAQLVRGIQSKAGNEWAKVELDKLSS